MSDEAWGWDETLYVGSAAFYAAGRMPYPEALGDSLRQELGLNGTQRLLDVGCGPGSLTLLLAPFVARAIGLDADREMVAEAHRASERAGMTNVTWRYMRAEALPADLGRVDVVTFAQSFHWMDRAKVAHGVREMLGPNGACVHIKATTHRGDTSEDPLPLPRPPYEAIGELVKSYLGPIRRAGRGSLLTGTPSDENQIFRSAGFAGPRHVDAAAGQVVTRSVDEIVASTFSLLSSTPYLLAGRREAFERDLRTLLTKASPDGLFCERTRDISLDIWRPRT